MSAVTNRMLYCDGPMCDEPCYGQGLVDPHISIRGQRQMAKADGWARIKGKDYCPACSAAQEERRG